MPIYGRSLRDASTQFQHQLNSSLARTITYTPLHLVVNDRVGIASIGFPSRLGAQGFTELNTRYGPVNLYIGHTCDVVEDEQTGRLRLRTIAYEYSVRPVAMDDRLFRWEFVRFPNASSRWCRHHVQGQVGFDILDHRNEIQTIDLNDWHLPTGWVAIEDVIRFCLHDLGARALSEPEEWHQALLDSYETFQTGYPGR